MNIHRIQNYLTLTLDDGTIFTTNNATDELFDKVISKVNDKEALIRIFNPDYYDKTAFIDRIKKSNYMTYEGNSVYIKSISELTLPQDFAEKFIEAEENKDYKKIDTYLNFWTLLSLNPDSRVRNNIFWFIRKWDIKITQSGLLVCYRNADIKHEGTIYNQELTEFVTTKYWEKRQSKHDTPKGYMVVSRNDNYYLVDESYEFKEDDCVYIGDLIDLYEILTNSDTSDDTTTTYTDHHTHTFKIKIGHVVSMPRENVDSDSQVSCSCGLHSAGKNWLEKNYFGTVGMRVLVNPADICAIPTVEDNYGKMRTCAYYPVSIVKYDSDGHIINEDIDDGYEDDFINKICYNGVINNEDVDNYRVDVPNITELDKEKVYNNLLDLAQRTLHKEIHIKR